MKRLKGALSILGLRARLAIIVALVLVPFLLYATWDSIKKAEASEQAAFERATSSARLAANQIEERARSLYQLSRIVATHVGDNHADAAGIEAYFSQLAPVAGEDVSRLQLVDVQGRVVAALRTPRLRRDQFGYTGETWFDDAIRAASVRWSGIVASPLTGNPDFVIVHPIRSEAAASILGVIAASIDVKNVVKSIANDLPRERLIYILDDAGRKVGRISSDDSAAAWSPAETKIAEAALIALRRSVEGRGWLEVNGTRYAAGASRIAGLPWGVTIGIPEEEVTGLVWAEARRRVAVSLLFAAFAGALAFWAARSVVTPLAAIGDGLRQLIDGETGVRVPVMGRGEVARLGRNFNSAVAEIERSREALERSEERFRRLAELSNDWFWETDAAHCFRQISAEVEFGTQIEHVGLRRWELPGVDGTGAHWDAHRLDLAAHRAFRDFEFSRTDRDGRLVWCSISGAPHFGADGAFQGYQGTGHYITGRKQAERALHDSANQMRLIAESVPAMIAYSDATGRIIYANAAYADFYGGADAVPVGRTVREFIGEEAWREAAPQQERARRGETVSCEARRRAANGAWRDIEVTLRPHRGESGDVLGIYTFILDVTERRSADTTLRLRNRALDSSNDAIIITEHELSDFRISYVNPAFERITGYSATEALGRNPRFLHGHEHDQPGLTELRLALRESREATALLRNYRKDGTPWWSEVRIAPVRDPSGRVTHYVGISSDVSARVRYEQELERHANFDTLTGLANRNLLRDRLGQAIAQAARAGTMVAVLFVDLDHFKRINDSLGHATGDTVLRACANRLASVMRAGDTVARLGGDEFAVVVADLKSDADAARIAQKLREAVAVPLRIEAQELALSASVGIALYPRDGADAEALLRNADIAMNRAKEEGRDGVRYFTAELNERVVRFATLERDLRSAVAQNAFELYYQPVVDLRTRGWVGAEALIRWRRADGSMVSPADFIPVAEDSGLIVPIGQWVLETAARQARLWQPARGAPFVVSLNLSARQFRDPGLVDVIQGAITVAGLSPLAIKLEITESTVMRNAAVTTETLHQLRGLGVQLAVDDFGTGYSSLAYLKRFPIDTLKIDRAFVAGLPDDPDDRAICRSVIDLAHGLELDVVAEGVETSAQAAALMELGCEFAQGFLFGRPVPAAQFEAQRSAS